MGFKWKDYQSGGDWINAAEKKVITENGIPLTITAIRVGSYDGDPRYELSVTVANPETGEDEERSIAFSIGSGVESRDRALEAFKEALEAGELGDDERVIKLDKIGKATIIVPANPGE